MTLHLPDLYHWAPTDRRKSIVRHGLRPGSKPTVGSGITVGGLDEAGAGDARPMVCMSADAATAWRYSAGMRWMKHIPAWDLWQVRLDRSDEIFVLPFYGTAPNEIRCANRIPKSRLILLATKEVHT